MDTQYIVFCCMKRKKKCTRFHVGNLSNAATMCMIENDDYHPLPINKGN